MAPRSTNTSVSATSKDHNSHASSGFLETDAKGPSSSTLETPDPLEAKPRSNNIDGNSTPRRVSKPILFRSPFSFSSSPSTNQEQAQADIQQSPLEKNIEDPVERRRSLRHSISIRISAFTRKLSSSPSTKTQLSSDTDPSQSILKDISRPEECVDTTEIGFIQRRNMAEQNRGKVYGEDEYSLFEEESAIPGPATTKDGPSERVQIPPRTSSLPANVRPILDAHHDRTRSAPHITHVQRLSGVGFTPLLRSKSRMAMKKAFLRQSPVDWSEYDAPEAEYFIELQHVKQLKSALLEVVEHESCAGNYGLCEHKHKSRQSEKHDENGRRVIEEVDGDEGKDGEWYETMEEAWQQQRRMRSDGCL
ncbi:uncharacterized protein PAC_10939 [Phialocephala subalpina]|uniref:Uncharacterized protein n=1 Tax=Phialocephala subalpina TaxID=576137 RepID=A0A1L7X7Q3_9HELO|nr:uncharacterized protein PAC_10939 [Phialocephala subalpina]